MDQQTKNSESQPARGRSDLGDNVSSDVVNPQSSQSNHYSLPIKPNWTEVSDTQPTKTKETFGCSAISSLEPKQAPTFHKFPQLPIELRLKMMKFVLPDLRVIEILWDQKRHEYYTNCKVPAILHVNKEFREEGLKTYSLFIVDNNTTQSTEDVTGGGFNVWNALFGPAPVPGQVTSTSDTTTMASASATRNPNLAAQANEGGAELVQKPLGSYIDFGHDMIYVCLERYFEEWQCRMKIRDFLLSINAETAAKIQQIAIRPQRFSFNMIFQALSMFPNLRLCAAVNSDVCQSFANGDPHLVNPAPYLPAIGFKNVCREGNIRTKRWSVLERRTMGILTQQTYKDFEDQMAELKRRSEPLGLDREWMARLNFCMINIMRKGD
ncbi:uncharacterized protein LY89DRAFT_744888 [Mollisia scopiformis]|uniref:2EXR domain-containing protein n=1 Tax=Mollisia scopiformis TaxID=149040 RepID=A0A194XV10_MOLSC|nr:uncharacterized protein LY89DRAFT_744888 [Mollisia scopiformis]KUJ24160.1 hypothetical protein LY89DRAFT_744888 [Mollisia scopiformis]